MMILVQRAEWQLQLLGKEPCINAGISLTIRGPRRCRRQRHIWSNKNTSDLLAKGYDAEVALVAGKMDRGVAADEKIGFEIQSILDIYAADGQ